MASCQCVCRICHLVVFSGLCGYTSLDKKNPSFIPILSIFNLFIVNHSYLFTTGLIHVICDIICSSLVICL